MAGQERNVKRRHLYYYLPILARGTGSVLGRLGDVSERGLLLLTDAELHTGDRMELAIDLSEVDGLEGQQLTVDGIVRWSGSEQPQRLNCAGIEFEGPSEEACNVIAWLVETIGFKDLEPMRRRPLSS